MKYFYGPMSKNVIDTIIQYSFDHPELQITFIPSRRQIENTGGYVNNWKTSDFVNYVKSKNHNILIERDHGGPNQGYIEDDGFESLSEDAKYLDIIHIDPWKKYFNIDEGIICTIKMINHCYSINKSVIYEISTEEAIRPFSVEELEYIIQQLQTYLLPDVFEKIKYLVIQCGTKLSEGANIGEFDKDKLKQMLELAKKYNLIAKEHNGDWVDLAIIKQKEQIGLLCLNIAPELGEIESRVILNKIKMNNEDYEKMYSLCIDSGKWKKWVSSDFDYKNKKDEIILICGHYIFSNPDFITMKAKYINIDNEIQTTIYDRLLELHNIYTIRKKCIFCNSDNFEILFTQDYNSSLSLGMSSNINEKSHFMPYNVQICKNCKSFQNKYIGNLSIVYNVNHIDDYGSTKHKKHSMFCDFILENKNRIDGIIEVGSCNGVLAHQITNHIDTDYTIIEPSFTGDRTKLNIIPEYFENVDLCSIKSNTIIMSDVFEHFYNPCNILEKLQQNSNIQFIYLNHPDFDYSIKNNIQINLNCEHTFLIKHDFLFTLFENFGFKLKRRFDFENFSLFLEFERINGKIIEKPLINSNLEDDGKFYLNNLVTIVNHMNIFIKQNLSKKIFVWPSSIHIITLFNLGLDFKNICGILDNSPNKIGKYLYGYNLLCSSFNNMLKTTDDDVIIFISGAGNYIKELDIKNTNITFKFLEDFVY